MTLDWGSMVEEPTSTRDLSEITGRDHLSFSQLNVMQQCGEKYKLSYIDRVDREPQGSWIGGLAVHGAIEDSEREDLWIPTDQVDETLTDTGTAQVVASFHKRFENGVRDAGGVDVIRWGGRGGTEHFGWWVKNGPHMCRRYVIARRAFAASGYAGVKHGTELRLEAEIAGRTVIGYIDKFLMRPLDPETGEVGTHRIVDWSTGMIGRKDPQQFATYAGLLFRQLGLVVVDGSAVYLRTADPDKQIEDVHFVGLVPELDHIYGDAVRAIEEGFFTARPNDYCNSCSVRRSCWHWKAVNA